MKIRQVYLSLIRTFAYYPDDSLRKPFSFLADDKKYYDVALRDYKFLGQQRDKNVPGVGKLRSVLDTLSSKVSPSGKVSTDSFFDSFRTYYDLLSQQRLIPTPHYPCVIDILPSKSEKYQMIPSTLPGSLGSVTGSRVSLSIRIYPAGLASLRMGCFLVTDENFDIKDLIKFLLSKRAEIQINGSRLSIEDLTYEYGKRVIDGLHEKNTKSLAWQDTYSMVDIIEADPLSLEKNSSDVFLPLLCLSEQPEGGAFASDNLSLKQDVFKVGTKSAVTYLPSGDEADRKKVRRLLRNFLELFFIQKFSIDKVYAMIVGNTFGNLKGGYWVNIFKRGVLPPEINRLFSVWNYLNLHLQDCPLKKEEWKRRYAGILNVLDRDNKIGVYNEKAVALLNDIKQQQGEAQSEVGKWIDKMLEIPKNVKDLLVK
jgi:hypothetical protein